VQQLKTMYTVQLQSELSVKFAAYKFSTVFVKTFSIGSQKYQSVHTFKSHSTENSAALRSIL